MKKNAIIFLLIILCGFNSFFCFEIVNTCNNIDKTNGNIVKMNEQIKNMNTATKLSRRGNVINKEVVNKSVVNHANDELFICPYCNNGLGMFTSSGTTSVAQLRCYFCGYQTPEVHINKPDAELECAKKCKENFKSGKWSNEDIIGESEN